MGAQHSCPIPMKQDFMVPKSRKFMSTRLCEKEAKGERGGEDDEEENDDYSTSSAPPTAATTIATTPSKGDLQFRLLSCHWNVSGDALLQHCPMPCLGTCLETLDTDFGNKLGEHMMAVKDMRNDAPLAVLRQPANYKSPLQICTKTKPQSADGSPVAVVTHQDGIDWYEYATVERNSDKDKQFVLRFTTNGLDSSNNVTTYQWRTDACGKGRRRSKDYIIHAVPVNDDDGTSPRQDKAKRISCLGAYVQKEKYYLSWIMHIAAPVDTLLILCFALCINRQAAREQNFLRTVRRKSKIRDFRRQALSHSYI